MKFYDELKWRGLIKDESSSEIEDLINNGEVTFYWGTDPTADSLHLGHYSSLVTAKRFLKAGHHPILLMGGATGLIGDPRPTAEREIIDKDVLNHNLECIKKQVGKIVDDGTGKVKFVNNNDWMSKFTFTDFLRDAGKYINVNYMLDKDIIRRRLESGITFAEFAYTLIQGYDFYHLFTEEGCSMQVAGSDQWGNITTGIDLIRKLTGKEAFGFTMPLVLDKSGKKFGKSEGNALWLDEDKASSYDLYQYLINTDDEMVISYLKIFTFLTPEEINNIEKEHLADPGKRIAQRALAREIITDLHGEESFNNAVKISESLFNGDISSFSEKDIKDAFKGLEPFTINSDCNVVDLLVNSGACSSKREAREFINNGSITINGEKISDLELVINKDKCLYNKYIIIRRGKKKYYIGIYE